jgi:hypothetical protein
VPSTLAQYNTIQAAIDASNSGDTVYVHGSPNAYSAFTINGKKITVIGPGWSPDKNLPFGASVPGMTLTGASAAGTEIQGLVITSTVDINTNHPDNLRIIRNYFTVERRFIFHKVVPLTLGIYLKEMYLITPKSWRLVQVLTKIFCFRIIIFMNMDVALLAISRAL